MTRDFNGYRQHQEEYEFYNRKNQSWQLCKRWVFYVTGFCFDDIHCHVLKSDGSKEMAPIDDQQRILINSKWYSRRFWNH